MLPICHWLRFDQKTSGLYTYTYSLHRATQALGYESHICYSDNDLKDGGTINLPNPVIGKVDFSPWTVSKGAINITHDQLPHMKLDNWIAEMHGHPLFAASEMDSLVACMHKLERVKLILTRFPSHVQYWQQCTRAPIHTIPPGVDLEYWKPEGKKQFFKRPIILWADTVRPPIKDPTALLYAMKIISNELPLHGLKLVGIPPNELMGYAYFWGALRLDSAIEYPIEPMTLNMGELYRAAEVMYSDTNEEGSNASWEAEACGCPVIHHKNSPEEIAWEIIEQVKEGKPQTQRRDIKDTAKAMIAVLEDAFP